MAKTLGERLENLIRDPNITQEQLALFEERLLQNRNYIDSKTYKSWFLFIIVSSTWILIQSKSINKLSFFGIEFIDLSILLLILPPIAAYFYYCI